jgi:hypothetical protein
LGECRDGEVGGGLLGKKVGGLVEEGFFHEDLFERRCFFDGLGVLFA